MTRRLIALALFVSVALAGCGAPTVPDFTYFRLPRPQPLEADGTPLFRGALVVDAFGADGLYADQALIYALDPGAQQLRQYHYQLWTDPPTRILQRRLIEQLRDANVAAQVTDELPASHPAIRVSGTILRFDRVPSAAGGYDAVVALKLRADARDGTPFVDDYYRAEKAADGADLKATVDAYGAALDEIFARFHADLRKRGADIHAG
ncbi:ABC-type transport auxiliary lipoprotein family protein [Dokdonella soli]|uniref:ABC-type transport auxiliary lipoprotein component domain-containing protein n=1 Tax=Dokdonella soli TaxID=529810 RepID=A0ABP3TPE7_9GAMM